MPQGLNIKKLSMRSATINDARIIFELSNDYIVRANSINQNSIIWEDHLIWLNKKIIDDNYFIFLFFIENNFIGQVKFEIKNLEEATISISIEKSCRGRGLAGILLMRGIQRIYEEKKNIKRIDAYIKPNNIASLKSFIKAGFLYDATVKINNVMFNKYSYIRKNGD